MKINFTYNKIEYTLCTITEFAQLILKHLTKTNKAKQTRFLADFALSDIYDNDTIDMQHPCDIVEGAQGWFGVKELGEIGFNNTDSRQLIFDYYGGQFHSFNSWEIDIEELADLKNGWGLKPDEFGIKSFEIKNIICNMLDITNPNYNILVQWTQDECLVCDEKEAVKPIEDMAVTNFAEMLCDYVSGLDEGEGIGREDIIDHLYEYINWDKRFTREYEEGKKGFKPF
ncbi:MAG TPA: hypothetical protein DD377_01330 [Firmicutes bacterium]|nr:hypothetical protein [Bacillota bacterium]